MLQLWGTDVELARGRRWAARASYVGRESCSARRRRSRGCPRARRTRRARRPGGVRSRSPSASLTNHPTSSSSAASEEKGVTTSRGDRGHAAGDRRRRPLRDRVPDAVGFVPPRELGPYYERAAVVVCPSHREGYGVVAREAMAHGRPGGRDGRRRALDAVEDGVTGLLVPPRDPRGLRAAIEASRRRGARSRLGAAAQGGAASTPRGGVRRCDDRAYRDALAAVAGSASILGWREAARCGSGGCGARRRHRSRDLSLRSTTSGATRKRPRSTTIGSSPGQLAGRRQARSDQAPLDPGGQAYHVVGAERRGHGADRAVHRPVRSVLLMPRRPARPAPQWILCYGCDTAGLDLPAEVVWTNGGGISI